MLREIFFLVYVVPGRVANPVVPALQLFMDPSKTSLKHVGFA